jgi:hypothetical protein
MVGAHQSFRHADENALRGSTPRVCPHSMQMLLPSSRPPQPLPPCSHEWTFQISAPAPWCGDRAKCWWRRLQLRLPPFKSQISSEYSYVHFSSGVTRAFANDLGIDAPGTRNGRSRERSFRRR